MVLLARAFGRRCPSCGSRGIFETYFRLREHCPGCGLHLSRHEHGYQVGAYLLNIAVSELAGVIVLLTAAVATWPNPPWDILLYGGVALMIAAPILFYPFAKTLFLALDLTFRPSGQE
jgi:uncharacterized protein (DUF983 family)